MVVNHTRVITRNANVFALEQTISSPTKGVYRFEPTWVLLPLGIVVEHISYTDLHVLRDFAASVTHCTYHNVFTSAYLYWIGDTMHVEYITSHVLHYVSMCKW